MVLELNYDMCTHTHVHAHK